MRPKIKQATKVKTLVIPRHLRFLKGRYGRLYAGVLTLSLQIPLWSYSIYVTSKYSLDLYSALWLVFLTSIVAKVIYNYWQRKLDFVLTLQTIHGMINGN